tara:strand:- start:325 stop:471 length:147 start_codon:yes stop_codon:yes gene_type:complete
MQSAREFEEHHGPGVRELFGGGMGTTMPAKHGVGVINSAPGKVSGKGT